MDKLAVLEQMLENMFNDMFDYSRSEVEDTNWLFIRVELKVPMGNWPAGTKFQRISFNAISRDLICDHNDGVYFYLLNFSVVEN